MRDTETIIYRTSSLLVLLAEITWDCLVEVTIFRKFCSLVLRAFCLTRCRVKPLVVDCAKSSRAMSICMKWGSRILQNISPPIFFLILPYLRQRTFSPTNELELLPFMCRLRHGLFDMFEVILSDFFSQSDCRGLWIVVILITNQYWASCIMCCLQNLNFEISLLRKLIIKKHYYAWQSNSKINQIASHHCTRIILSIRKNWNTRANEATERPCKVLDKTNDDSWSTESKSCTLLVFQ